MHVQNIYPAHPENCDHKAKMCLRRTYIQRTPRTVIKGYDVRARDTLVHVIARHLVTNAEFDQKIRPDSFPSCLPSLLLAGNVEESTSVLVCTVD